MKIALLVVFNALCALVNAGFALNFALNGDMKGFTAHTIVCMFNAGVASLLYLRGR